MTNKSCAASVLGTGILFCFASSFNNVSYVVRFECFNVCSVSFNFSYSLNLCDTCNKDSKGLEFLARSATCNSALNRFEVLDCFLGERVLGIVFLKGPK